MFENYIFFYLYRYEINFFNRPEFKFPIQTNVYVRINFIFLFFSFIQKCIVVFLISYSFKTFYEFRCTSMTRRVTVVC